MRLHLFLMLFLLPFFIVNASVQVFSHNTVGSSATQYDLHVRVLPEAHRLEVSGTMLLPAESTPRAQIQLSLSELMLDLNIEVLSPASSSGSAELEKAKAENGSVTWNVRPPRPIRAGETVLLRFSYAGGGQVANIFYVGPEVSFASAYATDWYPIWLRAGGYNRGVGSLKISVPAGDTAIAEGMRRSSPQQEAQGTFLFENNHPTYFSFASGRYTILRRNGTIPVSVYLLRPRQNMERYLEEVAKMFDFLVQEFGPYHFDEFTLVEIPRELAQKASFNAATVQGFAYVNSNAFNVPASRFNGILEWYGHEFTHEWWPNTVALIRPGGRYMEEALAEYGGLRVVETLAGAAAAEQYRRRGYQPDPIYSALEYFKLVGAGFDRKLADLPPGIKFHNIAYNKGFLVWDMLSREIGMEKFRRVLQHIIDRYAFQELPWSEFWRALEAGAGCDLKWFYEQWFERTGAPDFQLTWRQEGNRVRCVITQAAPYYRATLEIEIRGSEEQRLIRKVSVRGALAEFTVPVRFHVQSVVVDPHYLVLRWTPEYRIASEAARTQSAISQ